MLINDRNLETSLSRIKCFLQADIFNNFIILKINFSEIPFIFFLRKKPSNETSWISFNYQTLIKVEFSNESVWKMINFIFHTLF